jgi:hypothetical protein
MKIKHDKTIVTLEITMHELSIITNALGHMNTDYQLYKEFSDFQHKVINL